MPITMNQIPASIRVPGQYIEVDNTRAVRGLPGMQHRILVIGQRLATGNVAENVLTKITNANQAAAAFGIGSMVHQMCEKLRGANDWQEVNVLALDDKAAGVAATGSILLGGASIKSGTVNLYIGGRRVQAGVTVSDTPATIAAKIVAAINASAMVSVTAAVNGVDDKQVDLAARHKGEAGNDIDVRLNYYLDEKTPDGLTATITAMNGGAGNPDISTAIAAIGEEWFTEIIMPYSDAANLTALETELDSLFGPLVMRDGMAYCFKSGTHAQLTTFGAGRNSPHVTCLGLKGCPNPPWEVAAVYGGIAAYYLAIDPAAPLQTLQLKGILAPQSADKFTLMERNLLLFDGIATARENVGILQIDREITMYQVNVQGAEDPSYLDVTTLATIAYLRWSEATRIALRFPRHKLRQNGTPGNNIATPAKIEDELIALATEWEAVGLIENLEDFKKKIVVEIDQGDPNRINVLNPSDIVNQLRIYASKLEFRV